MTGTGTILSSGSVVWQTWNDTSATSTTSAVWSGWLTAASNTTSAITVTSAASQDDALRRFYAIPHAAPTPADLAARELVRAEEKRIREAANARAESLLVEHLTPAQRAQLRGEGYFDVVVQGKTYRIQRGRAGNVHQLDAGGQRVARFCAHPRELCPDADTMLAQKLMLETAEPEFLRIANRHPV